METKSVLASKTVWVNAAIAAGAVVWNAVSATFPAEIVAVTVPLANILLRFLSSKKITF